MWLIREPSGGRPVATRSSSSAALSPYEKSDSIILYPSISCKQNGVSMLFYWSARLYPELPQVDVSGVRATRKNWLT